MKIYEIEHGQKVPVYKKGEDIQKFILKVQKECSIAWNTYAKVGNALFRGVKGAGPTTMFKGKTRIDRKSVDTPEEFNNLLDEALRVMGYKATRSNSIFCSPSLKTADMYGKSFIIFPKNNASYTWSPTVRDLYAELNNANAHYVRSLLKSGDYYAIVNELEYRKNTGLEEALQGETEVMVSGEYYACSLNDYYDDLDPFLFDKNRTINS